LNRRDDAVWDYLLRVRIGEDDGMNDGGDDDEEEQVLLKK